MKRLEYLKKYQASREAMKKIVRDYHFLLGLEYPTVLQIRRLEAIAEYLGRDIEEWRTEHMRDEHAQLMSSGLPKERKIQLVWTKKKSKKWRLLRDGEHPNVPYNVHIYRRILDGKVVKTERWACFSKMEYSLVKRSRR